jgi:hypothetical protein
MINTMMKRMRGLSALVALGAAAAVTSTAAIAAADGQLITPSIVDELSCSECPSERGCGQSGHPEGLLEPGAGSALVWEVPKHRIPHLLAYGATQREGERDHGN